MRQSAIFMFSAILGCVLPTDTAAQRATIFYYHSPGGSRIEHQLPGDLRDQRRLGVPKRLTLPVDGEVCVLVEHANPLLYSYSLRQQPINVDVPSDAKAIASALAGVLSGAGTPPGGESDGLTLINVYGDTVAALFQRVLELNAFRLETDGTLDFTHSALDAGKRFEEARRLHLVAAEMYDHPSLEALRNDNPSLRLLRAAHLRTWQEAEAVYKEFEDARSKLGRPLCESVGSQVVSVRLAIARTNNGPERPLRATGDSLLAVDVVPRSNRTIEIGAGGILTILVQDQREFTISEGVIVGQDNHEPRLQPGVFLLGRAWSERWLWGVVGASADDSGLSNVFLGMAGRFGDEIAGLRMTLGIGVSVTRTVVGLENGLTEGEPLPPDAGKLEDLLDRELRAGLGFLFSLSGA
jgi:hypothetical protein